MRQYEPPGGTPPGTPAQAGAADTDEIRVEIEQTRTELSGTIDAIQQKLAPEVLTEQAKDVAREATDQAKAAAQEVLQDAVREVKDAALEVTQQAVHDVKEAAREVTGEAKDAAWDATVGRAEHAVSTAGDTAKGVGSLVIETIKQNPIPAALAGISLAWLYMKRPSAQATAGASAGAGPYRPTTYAAPHLHDTYAPRTGYAPTDATLRATDTSPPVRSAYVSRGVAAGTDQTGESGGLVSEVASQAGDLAGQAGEFASDVASSVASGAGQVASGAGEMVSGAGETALDAGSTVMDLIRRNPVPAALVGIGLGWLYMNRTVSSGPDLRAHSGTHYRYGPQRAASARGSGYAASGASDGGVAGMARDMGDQVGQAAGTVQEQAGQLAGSVQEQASEMAGMVMDQTRQAPGQLQEMMAGSPLMTAALAATVGAAVGLALPATETESRVIGPMRDRVMGRAQEVTDDTIEKVSSVAQEVQSTVTREARSQGLTV